MAGRPPPPIRIPPSAENAEAEARKIAAEDRARVGGKESTKELIQIIGKISDSIKNYAGTDNKIHTDEMRRVLDKMVRRLKMRLLTYTDSKPKFPISEKEKDEGDALVLAAEVLLKPRGGRRTHKRSRRRRYTRQN